MSCIPNENRLRAVELREKKYEGSKCKKCGTLIKYTINGSCVECTLRRSRKNLDNKELMAKYRTKQKKTRQYSDYKRIQREENFDSTFNGDIFLSKYGLTHKEYDGMFKSQGGKCKICGNKFDYRLHVDHCHTTGKVRGLLCRGCNTGLGQFQDDPRILREAINYLMRTDNETIC